MLAPSFLFLTGFPMVILITASTREAALQSCEVSIGRQHVSAKPKDPQSVVHTTTNRCRRVSFKNKVSCSTLGVGCEALGSSVTAWEVWT